MSSFLFEDLLTLLEHFLKFLLVMGSRSRNENGSILLYIHLTFLRKKKVLDILYNKLCFRKINVE